MELMLWKKNASGLGLIDPIEAMKALLTKWIVRVIEVEESNL
jgi:hypothetical protein